MLMLLAAAAVLVAGALLPLAFEDEDEDDDTPETVEEDGGDLIEGMEALVEEDLSAPEVTEIVAEGEGASDVVDPQAEQPGMEASDVTVAPEPTETVTEEFREGRTFVTGSDEGDQIDVPARAFVTGGEGADTFALDGSTPIGSQAEIADFDPEEDRLVIVWDDAPGSAAPEVSLGQIEDAPDMSQVLVNGVVVAHVANGAGLTVENIGLVPASLARVG